MTDIEEKWEKKWEEAKIFEPKVKNRKKFMITVPWPYTNGSLHVGHGRTYTLGDIIARYKRARGYNVLFPMGFHQSGTPILAFSERIRSGDKATIDLYRSYVGEYDDQNVDSLIESFKEPKNIADYFSNAIVHDFKRLGYSIDWSRQFTSADEFYQKFVQWQFRKLNSEGLIKQDRYPILYSLNDENAVGEDDIKDGDTDKVTVEEFTAVIFRNDAFCLVAASLRPETVYGITNLWISEQGEYVKFRMHDNVLVSSREGFQKISLQNPEVEFINDVSREEILSREFISPETGRSLKVYTAGFVDPDNGTGIVYSVPSHSVYDRIYYDKMFKNQDSPAVIKSRSNISGVMSSYSMETAEGRDSATKDLYRDEFYYGKLINSGSYTGLTVQEAREKMASDMIGAGNAFVFYETSRKAVTRSGSKVIVAVLPDQWFIDYSQKWLKEESHRMIDGITIYPEMYRKILHDAIDWLKERPCARRRGLGTKLPFDERWVIESLSDSTIYPAVYTCSRKLEGIYRNGNLNEKVLDFIFDGGTVQPSDDSSTAKEEFNYWYPVDIRLTAIPHVSNHISFYIMNHAAIFPEKFWPGGIIISGLVVSNGAKISKSKGNVISLLEITKRYSADVYRLYVAVQADISSAMDWNEDDLSSVVKRFNEFKEIMSAHKKSEEEINFIDAWFIARFAVRLRRYMSAMDHFVIRDAYIDIFYGVLNDIKTLESRGGNRDLVIGYIIRDWLIALTPVVPHTTEELWHSYIEDSFASIAYIDDNPVTRYESIIEKFGMSVDSFYGVLDYVDQVISDIKEIADVAKIKPKEITIITADRSVLKACHNFIDGKLDEEDKKIVPFIAKHRRDIRFQEFSEYDMIMKNKSYIENTFDSRLNVSEGSVYEKKIALPGRPVIIIA